MTTGRGWEASASAFGSSPQAFTSDRAELVRILHEDLQAAGPTPLWDGDVGWPCPRSIVKAAAASCSYSRTATTIPIPPIRT